MFGSRPTWPIKVVAGPMRFVAADKSARVAPHSIAEPRYGAAAAAAAAIDFPSFSYRRG